MSKYAPHHKSTNSPRATPTTVCQKCLGTGHFIYQCKKPAPYVSRPSRTQQLEDPRVKRDVPSVEVPPEFTKKSGTANRILEAKEKERAEASTEKGKGKDDGRDKERSRKRARRSSRSDSSSDSSSDSDSESDSSSSSGSNSDSSSSSSGSSRRSRRKVPRGRGRDSSHSLSRSP